MCNAVLDFLASLPALKRLAIHDNPLIEERKRQYGKCNCNGQLRFETRKQLQKVEGSPSQDPMGDHHGLTFSVRFRSLVIRC